MGDNFISENTKGLRKLIDVLRNSTSSANNEIFEENHDALSLMVDETIKGTDIRSSFPLFYSRLVENADLRQRFLDAVRQVYADSTSGSVHYRTIKQIEADLLLSLAAQGKKWQLTLQELSAIFFPIQKVYRSDAPGSSPAYLLLNEEIELQPVIYSIQVEGKLSEEKENTLALYTYLAITEIAETNFLALPVELTIEWGGYTEKMSLASEGQFHLADVPLSEFLDENKRRVIAPLEISITRP